MQIHNIVFSLCFLILLLSSNVYTEHPVSVPVACHFFAVLFLFLFYSRFARVQFLCDVYMYVCTRIRMWVYFVWSSGNFLVSFIHPCVTLCSDRQREHDTETSVARHHDGFARSQIHCAAHQRCGQGQRGKNITGSGVRPIKSRMMIQNTG